MKGYWNKPEQTAAVLRDGWYYSGDLGYMDEAGYVVLVDRAKDMIISGGENVYGSEVEEALYLHPAVLEAAVFGIPDQKWGEVVKAIVKKKEGAELTEEEVIHWCRNRLAGFKTPRVVEMGDIPRTATGKIQKNVLKQREKELAGISW